MENDNLSGEIPATLAGPRSKQPGLREIAAHLQLSPATVSMVINNVPLAKSLSAATRARVLEAAKEFNYRPNLLARSLTKRQSRTVGVIAPESSDGYFTRVMRGLETALLDAGYLYFTASHLNREDLIREYPAALVQRGVDGLIFVNTPIYELPCVPAVSISNPCEVEGVTSIVVDQRGGMDRAMQHLYDLGHRRILLMHGRHRSLDAEERYNAMLAAARRLGLETPPELQLILETNLLTPDTAFRAFRQLLADRPHFTAVFAYNDTAAIGAIRAMADAGISCPHDVSVLGVDDIGTAAFFLPRISTASQPLEDMGVAAVKQLIARLQRPEETHPRRVLLPMSMQLRESTAPTRVTDAHRWETSSTDAHRRVPAGV